MIRGLSRAVDARTAPFAWEPDGDGRPVLVGARVTQCALSRICGACAASLGRPVAFVGDADEVARNAFHAPALHEDCARALAAGSPDLQVVLTAGFEFVRPAAGQDDRRPTFQPNSLL
ncbi:hypothetical protein I601_0380 [Nocardioides dokdonensis FR1436]|uniref:Uncharacterized protein n=1 Tax=Nocardioides dokdonensis FR1436 TaxID=1300347 RepID=A0A1A9GGR4_9ACTN|nr:hypothetical protein [Nocardioides dokdonensis]ANH36832.1 hypothetical protein I601_0380 [Nocardioides dokdonensis FR1436]